MRQLFGTNDAIEVITPTGSAAYLFQGSTVHSFLGISTGGRSCNELTVPVGTVLERIQKKVLEFESSGWGRAIDVWTHHNGLDGKSRTLCSEQRSQCRRAMGGIPVVVLMGDDVQLPPVCDTPVYIQDCRSAPSNHGRLVLTMFDSAVELTEIVRQTESEQQLRGVLMSSRTYNTTCQEIHWLQQFQWHNLRLTHGTELLGRMDEQVPTNRLEWERNKTKLLECNRKPNHPVARINSRQLAMAGMHRKLAVVRRKGCYQYCIFAVTAKSCW